MHLLLTGGTGLLGRALCAALRGAGHELTVLSRRPQAVAALCGPGVRALPSLDGYGADAAFDAVVNLAGQPIVDRPWTDARQRELRDSRIALTARLVERIAAARTKPKVLLSGSAIGWYGDRGDEWLDEGSSPAADFAARLCRDWEAEAARAASLGVRVCLLRTGLVLDASGGLLGRMLPAFRLGLGARLGDGRQWMSWIAIDDFVGAVLHLLGDARCEGACNFTAPQPVTNAEFTGALAAALHRPALLPAPAFALRLALGRRAYMLLGGQRVRPARLQAAGYAFAQPALADALRSQLTSK